MYEIAPAVAGVMATRGIKEQELQHMVRYSAMCRQRRGFNRRFHDWLFHVSGTVVLSMARL